MSFWQGEHRGGGAGRRSSKPAEKPTRPAEWRRIRALFGHYRWNLGLLLGLIVVSAAISLIPAFLLRIVVDELGKGPQIDTRTLYIAVAGMVVIPIVTGVLGVGQTWQSNRVGQQVMHDLRTAVYTHLQRLSLAFFTRTRTGEVQSRIASDIGGVQSVVTTTATSLVSNVTTVVATAVAMVFLDWRLALAAFALLPIFVLMTRRVGEVRRALTHTMQSTVADMSTLVEESLSVSGVLLGKTMGQADELTRRFEVESQNLADLELRQRMAGRWVMSSIQMSFAIMPALVYGVAGHVMSTGSTALGVGTVVAFTTLQNRLFFPMQSLLSVQSDVQASLALFERVFEYLDMPVDISEREDAVELDRNEMRGEVVVDDVSFRYDEQRPTLEHVSFVAPPGSRVAIVGETGSGKTTLGYLLARLYDVESGSIRIDGVDLRDLSFSSLRTAIGVVSQETYLFHGTVRDNLRFARPDASDDEIEEAARAAQIHDHIVSLRDGYDTIVGERGYRFSGGEKQRLAIARTVLRNPPVLILDEATSALDVETERQVQVALERLSAGRTTVAIAHRLSTVRDADTILLIDRGRVVERGTHQELLELGGRYAALVERDVDSGSLREVGRA
jgi:ATP-binding cassette subfamily B protein